MLTKRRHFIELHEQKWYPPLLRGLFQDAMSQAVVMADVYKNIVGDFAELLDRVDADSVLDLCSGSGGPAIHVCKKTASLRKGGLAPRVVLSDLYPNVERFEHLKRSFDGVDYFSAPVDAMHPPNGPSLPRVRTMFGALHHFRPAQIGRMLKNAAESSDAIALFESTERTWTAMAAACTIPITGPLQTALALRPFRWSQVLFGLVVPVVPATGFFDALVSNLRSYTPSELGSIIQGVDAPDFEWKVGQSPAFGNLTHATYLFGWRRR